jgi:hypothetical protein
MAIVASPTEVTRWIDNYVSYLTDALNDLIEIEQEWDDWDELSRLTYVVEWPIKQDRLMQLERWASQSLLSEEQSGRYSTLLNLLEQRRPILERLLAD